MNSNISFVFPVKPDLMALSWNPQMQQENPFPYAAQVPC